MIEVAAEHDASHMLSTLKLPVFAPGGEKDRLVPCARVKDLRDLLDDLRLMPFAVETLNELRSRGHKLAIISGSLDVVVEHLLGEIEFDHVLINHIIAKKAGFSIAFNCKSEDLRTVCDREVKDRNIRSVADLL